MRFRRLELDRYGSFTDHHLEFGDAGQADFHLIFGPNEAGKSTLRNACEDFLYGFPGQTPYNFLHDYSALQVGADVDFSDGDRLSGRRLKRQKNDFVSADGAVLSDARLRAVLGDVSRQGYVQMFSLDEDSLKNGGEEILKSEGDLGRLLFAAASGLADISSGLDRIREETALFYKSSGRKHQLNTLKEKLKSLKEELARIDVQASGYAALRDAEETSRSTYENARQARDKHVARAEELKALLDVLEPLSELREASAALQELGYVPKLPEAWSERCASLSSELAAARTQVALCEDALVRARSTRQAITPDENVLAVAAAIARLSEDDLEARFRTSRDIDARRRERAALEERISELMREAGAPAGSVPDDLALSALVRERLENLGNAHRGLVQSLDAARAEERQAAQRLDALQQGENGACNVPDLGDLDRQFTSLRETDLGIGALETAERRQREAEADLARALASLAPWQGDGDALRATLGVDTSGLEGLTARLEGHARQANQLSEEARRLKEELAVAQDRVAGLEAEVGAADDTSLEGAMSRRDAAWTRHRDEIGAPEGPDAIRLKETAAAFEKELAHADAISVRRFDTAARLTELRTARAQIERTAAALRTCEEQAAAVSREGEAVQELRKKLISELGLPEQFALSRLDAWLARREDALGRLAAVERCKADCTATRTALETAEASLRQLMLAAGLQSASLSGRLLISECDHALEQWREAVRLQRETAKSVERAQADLKVRRDAMHEAETALAGWTAEWQAVLSSCWLGALPGGAPAPDDIRKQIIRIDRLGQEQRAAAELDRRIEGMRQDRDRYEAEVRRLAETLGEASDGDPLRCADRLRDRLTRAREDTRRAEVAEKTLSEADVAASEARVKLRGLEAELAEMTSEAEVEDLAGLQDLLGRCDRARALERRVEELRRGIARRLGVADFDAAKARIDDNLSDPERIIDLREELTSLGLDADMEGETVQALYHEWQTSLRDLNSVASDNDAARLEEERAVLRLQIEEETEAFLRLSAGTFVLEEALRGYRESHRSSMMSRASDAFVRMTRGGFQKLEAVPGDSGEILVGVRADGSSIVATEMSRGTQFQLYLALRIAGHAEFTQQREALPFFADDIFEPFDDDRAAETFRLLAGMSERGQVIYLTHHKHLCDIAKRVCGEERVRIHELPDRVRLATA